MYVKDYMTRNPVTATRDVPVSEALEIMNKGDFHRLPVVDGNGKLVGLVTESSIAESSGKNTTSLSIYELNYLLSRTKVEDIMIENVKTTKENIVLEEAANQMLEEKISVLPVVDDENHVVGIITERDMFSAFVELMGYHHQGTKFVIHCADKPGELAHVAKLFAEHDANTESLAVYHTKERGTEFVIKATGEVPVDTMLDVLEKEGLEVVSVIQTKDDGNEVIYKTNV